jgi:hypothetical protein
MVCDEVEDGSDEVVTIFSVEDATLEHFECSKQDQQPGTSRETRQETGESGGGKHCGFSHVTTILLVLICKSCVPAHVETWSKYNPTMLKKPKHAALQMRNTATDNDIDMESDPDDPMPMNTSSEYNCVGRK